MSRHVCGCKACVDAAALLLKRIEEFERLHPPQFRFDTPKNNTDEGKKK